MAGPAVTGSGKDIYGYDPTSMATDASDEAISNLGQLNRADTNGVNDSRAKTDLGYPAKRGN